MARRYLGLSAEQWDALGWDVRQCYLEGMCEDESVPLSTERQDQVRERLPEGIRQHRAPVPAGPGADVIDLQAMISGFDPASPHGRR